MGTDARLREEIIEEFPGMSQPSYSPVRQALVSATFSLSLFFSLSGTEPQRDKATCQDCTVQKGQMLDSVPGALLATSQPVLRALSIRTTQGLVRWKVGGIFPSCQGEFHCLETQVFLHSKTLQPNERAVSIAVCVLMGYALALNLPLCPSAPATIHSRGNLISGYPVP